MSLSTKRRLLGAAVQEVPVVLKKHGFADNTCILSSRLLIHVAHELSIRVKAIDCEADVVNEAWAENAEKALAMGTDKGRDFMMHVGAWHLTVGRRPHFQRDFKGYDGHVVVVAENRWLADPSLGQMNRPDKNIFLKPKIFDLPEDFFDGNPLVSEEQEQDGSSPKVYLRYLAKPSSKDFMKSPDWTMVRPNDPLVKEVLSRL